MANPNRAQRSGQRFRVGGGTKTFTTLDAAKQEADKIFRKKGIIVSVEAANPGGARRRGPVSVLEVGETRRAGTRIPAAPRGLSVPEQHQWRIAHQTLNMPSAIAGVMGGPNKEQARRIITALKAK